MRKFPFSRFLKAGLLLLGCCLLLAAAWYWKISPKQTSTASAPQPPQTTASSATASVQTSQSSGGSGSAGAAANPEGDLSRLTYANHWKSESKPAFAPFNTWVARYLSAPAASRPAMAAEGERLAADRRKAMEQLIQKDPEEAIASTVPSDVLNQLPPLVLNQIENRVSGRGNLEVNVVCFLPKKDKPDNDSVYRQVVLDKKTYQAFTYGRRGTEPTKYNIPLHGIALGNLMAVHESPVRVLAPGELPPAGSQITTVPLAASSTAPVQLQVGNVTIPSVSISQVLQIQTELAKAEIVPGPYVQISGTLASQLFPTETYFAPPYQPWTTGTTRVLIIRVDFSDFPGEPISQGNAQGLMDSLVKPFYEQGSYYRDSFVATVTAKTYRMPFSGAAYATAPDDYTFSDPFHSVANNKLHSDAEALAAADGYVLSNYDRIGVVFPNLSNLLGSYIYYGGLADIGGHRFWVNGEFDYRVVAHELGHTYGLFHANSWTGYNNDPIGSDGYSTEYGDVYDTMGGNYANRVVDFGPSRKLDLKWIDPVAITSASTSGVYRVYRFDNAAVTQGNTMAVTVSRNDGRSFWINYRKKNVSDSNLLTSAYVFWRDDREALSGTGPQNVDGLFAGYTNLLDLNTPGTNLADAGLRIGESITDFSNSNNVVTITPLKLGGAVPNEYMDVQVSFNNAVGFLKSSMDAQQADGTVTLVVKRTGDGVGNFKVDYSTINGSAISSRDYVGASGSLLWLDGDKSDRTITVGLKPGQIVNGIASFNVILSSPVGGYLTTGTSTVRIHDPGALNPQFAPPVAIFDYSLINQNPSDNTQVSGTFSGLVMSGTFLSASGSTSFLQNDITFLYNASMSGGLNGDVNSVIVQPNGQILVAGAFNAVNLNGTALLVGNIPVVFGNLIYYYYDSSYAGNLTLSGSVPGYARLNSDGSFDSSFHFGTGIPDPKTTPIKAMALQPNGKLLVAGNFPSISGTAIKKVARLLTSGTVDTTFSPVQIDGEVRALAVQPDSRILIGGSFAKISGTISRPAIVRLSGTGSLDSSFAIPLASATTGAVEAIALQPDGSILVGGSFVSGATSGIVRLLSSGSLDPSFNAGSGAIYFNATDKSSSAATVRAITVQPDGKIIVGGNFNTFGGQTQNHIVRLTSTGEVDGSFSASIDPSGDISSEVRSLAIDGAGGIIVGGEFTHVNSTPVNRIVRLLPDGSLDPDFYLATGASNTVNAISLAGDGSFALGLKVDISHLGDPVLQGYPDHAVSLLFGKGAPAGQLQWDASDYTVFVGSTAQVLVERIGGTHGAVSVNYSTVNGTAVSGSNYTANAGTLSWADGDASPRLIQINALGAQAGTYYLNLGIPIGGGQVATTGMATVHVSTGDQIPDQPNNLSPGNGVGLVPLQPTLTASDYSDPDGTGVDPQFASQWQIIRKSDGALIYDSGTDRSDLTSFTVPIQLTSGVEYQWRVRYRDSRGGWSLYSNLTSFITHSTISYQFGSASYFVAENVSKLPEQVLRVAVLRNTQAPETSSVRFSTRDGSGIAGIHYTGTSGILTFTGTQSSQEVLIPILDNNYPNPNAQFFVDLSDPSSGSELQSPSTTMVTVLDNEAPSFFNFAGNYYALISQDPAPNAKSGFINVSMNRNGVFTANVQYGSGVYRFTGQLGAYGHFNGLIPNTNLTLDLTLDMSGKDVIVGTLSDGSSTTAFTADRAVFDAKRYPAPQQGLYTILITSDTNATSNLLPQGDGYGTIKIDGNGNGRFVGTLADGTKLTQTLRLSKHGAWPFYTSLYKNQGWISGAVQFRDVPFHSDIDGNLTWFKPPSIGSALPWGFPVYPKLVGSRYIAPAKGSTVLNYATYLQNTKVSILDGSVIVTNPVKLVTWLTSNKIVNSTTEPFSLKVNPASGLFSGSFLDNISVKSKNFSGVFLQKTNIGGGFFLGNGGAAGRIEIEQNMYNP